jgi:hypothetical protein
VEPTKASVIESENQFFDEIAQAWDLLDPPTPKEFTPTRSNLSAGHGMGSVGTTSLQSANGTAYSLAMFSKFDFMAAEIYS